MNWQVVIIDREEHPFHLTVHRHQPRATFDMICRIANPDVVARVELRNQDRRVIDSFTLTREPQPEQVPFNFVTDWLAT